MKEATPRSIPRWIHLVFGIPFVGYVYDPSPVLPHYAPVVRFVAIPTLVLLGLWMRKGHLVRRVYARGAN